ncbi:unnamed protein product, partial [Prorocentrum cordatum]
EAATRAVRAGAPLTRAGSSRRRSGAGRSSRSRGLNRPPCTPNVRWLLTDRPIVARLEHIEELIRATLLRDPDGGFMDDGLIGDSRETQSSENRRLERVRLFNRFRSRSSLRRACWRRRARSGSAYGNLRIEKVYGTGGAASCPAIWACRIARYSKLFCACSFAILWGTVDAATEMQWWDEGRRQKDASTFEVDGDDHTFDESDERSWFRGGLDTCGRARTPRLWTMIGASIDLESGAMAVGEDGDRVGRQLIASPDKFAVHPALLQRVQVSDFAVDRDLRLPPKKKLASGGSRDKGKAAIDLRSLRRRA